jgi:hypothetical protein
MTIIYGIDTSKPISPHDVRDALIACFVAAHSDALEDLKNYGQQLNKDEFERMKVLNVQQMVLDFSKEVGGDYEAPTKNPCKSNRKTKGFAKISEI